MFQVTDLEPEICDALRESLRETRCSHGSPQKKTLEISNVSPTQPVAFSLTQNGLETGPENQMMSCFDWEKIVFRRFPANRVPGCSRCLLFLISFCLLFTRFFPQTGPKCSRYIQEKQDSSLLVVPLPLTMRIHLQTAFITMSQWVSPPKIRPHFLLLPRHFSLKPGTSACRPNEVVAGPASTAGSCHRCW